MSRVAVAEVREVETKDLPLLASIPGVERGWGVASLTKEFLTPSSVFGVVVVGGEAVGYAVLQVAGDEAYLSNVVVHPDFRGMGLGRLLLQWVLDQGISRGVTRVLLEVRESNAVAIGLYSSAGFREVGRRPRMYSDGETAVVMEKRIPDFDG